MRGLVVVIWVTALLFLAGCMSLIVQPWREHQCREDGGWPYSSHRMFGQYEGTTCYATDPLAPGGARVIWVK